MILNSCFSFIKGIFSIESVINKSSYRYNADKILDGRV